MTSRLEGVLTVRSRDQMSCRSKVNVSKRKKIIILLHFPFSEQFALPRQSGGCHVKSRAGRFIIFTSSSSSMCCLSDQSMPLPLFALLPFPPLLYSHPLYCKLTEQKVTSLMRKILFFPCGKPKLSLGRISFLFFILLLSGNIVSFAKKNFCSPFHKETSSETFSWCFRLRWLLSPIPPPFYSPLPSSPAFFGGENHQDL